MTTARQARLEAVRALRATGEIVPVQKASGDHWYLCRTCRWCAMSMLRRYLRIGANGTPECRAVKACEGRMQ
jgi:hypothetical protein